MGLYFVLSVLGFLALVVGAIKEPPKGVLWVPIVGTGVILAWSAWDFGWLLWG